MRDIFELASGSVAGRDHRITGKNNQDAVKTMVTDAGIIALVADGCSSGVKNEVGAILGVEYACSKLWSLIPFITNAEEFEEVRIRILHELENIVVSVGINRSKFVNDYLLFTLVGAAVLPDVTTFFSIGDGYLNVNGEVLPIGPFEGNMPPYIGYGLVTSEIDPALIKFQIHRSMPTSELSSFVIGTDGVLDLEAAAEKPFPGRTDPVGPLERLWNEDRFYKNPDMLRRHLTLVNGGVKDMNLPGYLKDDTTLVVGRRKKVNNV